MEAVLLSVHVLAGIVLIGPITVSASAFPRYGRAAASATGPAQTAALAGAAALHRITRSYAVPALAVPVFGIGVGAAMRVLGQVWLLIAMALTALAGGILVGFIIPAQSRVLAALTADSTLDRTAAGRTFGEPGPASVADRVTGNRDQHAAQTQPLTTILQVLGRLNLTTGTFALTWAVVVVLMIVRPGSTTGV